MIILSAVLLTAVFPVYFLNYFEEMILLVTDCLMSIEGIAACSMRLKKQIPYQFVGDCSKSTFAMHTVLLRSVNITVGLSLVRKGAELL